MSQCPTGCKLLEQLVCTFRSKKKTNSIPSTLFDPRINHCLESGTAMTIIIGKSELLTGWMPLPLMNPHMGDILEKMKQDLGIGWNLVQSGLNGISMVT